MSVQRLTTSAMSSSSTSSFSIRWFFCSSASAILSVLDLALELGQRPYWISEALA